MTDPYRWCVFVDELNPVDPDPGDRFRRSVFMLVRHDLRRRLPRLPEPRGAGDGEVEAAIEAVEKADS